MKSLFLSILSLSFFNIRKHSGICAFPGCHRYQKTGDKVGSVFVTYNGHETLRREFLLIRDAQYENDLEFNGDIEIEWSNKIELKNKNYDSIFTADITINELNISNEFVVCLLRDAPAP
jgi:hypothetical protein